MALPLPAVYIQGQGSVSADNLGTFVQTVGSVAQLRTLVGLTNMQIALLGLSVVGDGGQGSFYWASGTYSDDGINTIVPTGAVSGAWLRIPSNVIVQVSAIVTVSGTTISNTSQFVPINNTTGAAFSINLPPAPVTGRTITIKDFGGNAGVHNITINGNGNQIDGAGSYVLASNYQAVNLMYAFTSWGVW